MLPFPLAHRIDLIHRQADYALCLKPAKAESSISIVSCSASVTPFVAAASPAKSSRAPKAKIPSAKNRHYGFGKNRHYSIYRDIAPTQPAREARPLGSAVASEPADREDLVHSSPGCSDPPQGRWAGRWLASVDGPPA